MKHLSLLLILCVFFSCNGQSRSGTHNSQQSVKALSEVRYSQEDITLFESIIDSLKAYKSLPMSELVIKTAKFMLGTPYVAGTLEIDPEMLTINLTKTDCILFVEMCLALSQTAKSDNPTFEVYCGNIKQLRYRQGIVDGYSSRLHYTSSWIIQASGRGVLKEISQEIGGVQLNQQFSFMSTHPDSYRLLKSDPEMVARIRKTEETLNGYKYFYIPKTDLPSHINLIRDGDIICFNSAVKGLDIAHVAYAYWDNGVLTFIHASSSEMKVVINAIPLVEYTNGIKSHNGLRILRLL
ncbi:MAG: DUF1460 domain-containing protein [Bacteroidales bacterium]|nr:DUF1460 domain-containing protein [Bacteroidales bacterium]MDD4670623.1 DUF1460 domain-containing protein [Bacteroidales bacterium]